MSYRGRVIALFALVAAVAASSLTTGCTSSLASSAAPSGSAAAAPTVVLTPTKPAKAPQPMGTLPDGSKIVLLSWNDLGMHCFNSDFSQIAVLPPYNNLYAQVIRVGSDPSPITSGVTVEYRYPDNTYSVGGAGKPSKSNFWTYAKALFNVDLKPDIGLTGRGLSGAMDAKSGYFVADGIPVTDKRDIDAGTNNIYPFQVAEVTVKDSTGKAVAWTSVVTPVATEMRCDTCHSKTGAASVKSKIQATDDPYRNILLTHDKLAGTAFAKMGFKALADSTPVLCASCHSSNALGTKGKPGVLSLSNAMHKRHSNVGIPATTEGCQSCHPGPNTKCLRDVHSQTLNFQCQNCHGDIAKVATNPNPWLDEPRCDDPACHKNTPASMLTQSNALYKLSTGHHGGIFCEACHDSTHALAKSREPNDGLKFAALQNGDTSFLHTCSVCHGVASPEGQTKAHAPGN